MIWTEPLALFYWPNPAAGCNSLTEVRNSKLDIGRTGVKREISKIRFSEVKK
jgi:hypothetical protein